MKQARDVFLIVSALSLLTGLALAEVVYLNNGDIVHGELVGANNTQVTLKTAYGELEIPKKDIQRIDYQGGEGPAPPAPPREDTRPTRPGGSGTDLACHHRTLVLVRVRITREQPRRYQNSPAAVHRQLTSLYLHR